MVPRERSLSTVLDEQARRELTPPIVRVQRFVDYIEDVSPGGSIMVFAGEARPSLYNARPVLEAMRYVVRAKDAKLRVITGPMVMVAEDGTNGLLQLRDEGLVSEMFHKPTRWPSMHFRVIEADGDIYRSVTERLHSPLPDLCYEDEERGSFEDQQMVGGGVAGIFDAEAEALKDPTLWKIKPPDNPLLVTEQQLKAIMDAVPNGKKDLYYHTKDELAALLPKQEDSSLPN